MLKIRSTCVRVVLLMTMIAVLTSCGRNDGAGQSGKTSMSFATATPSQEAAKNAINQIIQPLVDDQWARGVVVGTVTKEQAVILSYGQLSDDNSQSPDANTVFEIGSLTKVFTALLLADMVERGEVSLEDPIGQFLPEGINVPKRADGDIRLADLATHTSGLPNIGDNFWEAGDSIFDPNAGGRRWSGYSTDKLFECLSNVASPIPGEREFVYSNLGMGLLGHLLERHSGKSYEELLIERICRPLDMDSTRITLTEELKSRFAAGHDADGNPSLPWDGTSSALTGAFAIRSTPQDLLNFLKANLGVIDSLLSPAIRATHAEKFKRSDLEQVGLGWNRNKFDVVFHSGTTGGFRCSMFMLPKSQVGAFVITNTLVGGSTDGRSAEFEKIGGSLLNVLVDVPPLPIAFPKTATLVSSDQLTDYVGQFNVRPEDSDGLRITAADGKLQALIPGRITRQLYPQSKDVFFMKAYDVELSFDRDESGGVNSVTARIGDQSHALARVPNG